MSGESVGAQAYHRLRGAITELRLEPGTTLRENDLARALGVSRTPVREALSRLELEGFIGRDDSGRLKVQRLTSDDVRHMFELRIILETYATQLAGERISDTELAALDRAIDADDQALRADDVEGLGGLNQTIHDIVLTASRNRALIDLVADLRHRLVGLTAFAVGDHDERAVFVGEHASLADLLRAGDGARAAALVEEHLQRARDLLIAGVERQEPMSDIDDLAYKLRQLDESS